MKIGFITLVLVAAAALVGCSDTIDGSSIEAYNRSLEKMTEKMTQAQRRQLGLDMALASESIQKMDVGQKVVAGLNEAYLIELLSKDLDGKSAADIKKMADARRVVNRKLAVKSTTEKIAEVEAKLAAETALQEDLRKIRFGEQSASVVYRPQDGMGAESVPKMHWAYQVNVKNDSKLTISGATFPEYSDFIISRGISGSFATPLKPGEEGVLTVYAFLNEHLSTLATAKVPPLEIKEADFQVVPAGKLREYAVNRSFDINMLTNTLKNAKEQLAKLQAQE